MIAMEDIEDAPQRIKDGEVRYRYVIEIAETMPVEA